MDKPKSIILLGSTGSIGTTVCRIVERYPDKFRIIAISCGQKAETFAGQILKFRPMLVSVKDNQTREKLKEILSKEKNYHLPTILTGDEGLLDVAAVQGGDLLVNALVGCTGLRPTVLALEKGLDVALANKETLVIGGKMVMDIAGENGAKILPIDSEHSAIFQCLQSIDEPCRNKVRRVILTASGGPFLENEPDEIHDATPDQVLKHPNWNMGPKVTVDSATLMNKGLEIIEAKTLFDLDDDQIEVVIHRQSIIHSLVEFMDGSVLAQMGYPSMEIPIQYALSYPNRFPTTLKPLNLVEIGRLTFEKPDLDRFPCLAIAKEASRSGEMVTACLNGADEGAVDLFLRNKIRFGRIPQLIKDVIANSDFTGDINIDNVLKMNDSARKNALEMIL